MLQWAFDHASQTARPGATAPIDAAIKAAKEKLNPPAAAAAAPPPPPPNPNAPAAAGRAAAAAALTPAYTPPAPMSAQERAAVQKTLEEAEARRAALLKQAARCPVEKVRLLHRHHFSSALQRMYRRRPLGCVGRRALSRRHSATLT